MAFSMSLIIYISLPAPSSFIFHIYILEALEHTLLGIVHIYPDKNIFPK